MKYLIPLLFSLFLSQISSELMLVNVPVSNLRSDKSSLQLTYEIDRNQLTQLLFNEPVEVIRIEQGYAYVKCLQQPNWDKLNATWVAYTGWMNLKELVPVQKVPNYDIAVSRNTAKVFGRNCLKGCLPSDQVAVVSMGTLFQSYQKERGWYTVRLPNGDSGYILETSLKVIETIDTVDRDIVVRTAQSMLGWYYFWGGRSNMIDELWNSGEQVTGVDCSGLVSLAYKSQGVILPRDADPIFRASKNVTHPSKLRPGDCFFYGDAAASHMTHIMMVGYNGMLIESTTGGANGTRTILIEEDFGTKLENLTWGQQIRSSFLYWGQPKSVKIE